MISGMAADLRSRTSTPSASAEATCVFAGRAVPARFARTRIGDIAQRGFDRRPHLFLIRRQMQPRLDAGDLRVIEHEAGGPVVAVMHGGRGRFDAVRPLRGRRRLRRRLFRRRPAAAALAAWAVAQRRPVAAGACGADAGTMRLRAEQAQGACCLSPRHSPSVCERDRYRRRLSQILREAQRHGLGGRKLGAARDRPVPAADHVTGKTRDND